MATFERGKFACVGAATQVEGRVRRRRRRRSRTVVRDRGGDRHRVRSLVTGLVLSRSTAAL